MPSPTRTLTADDIQRTVERANRWAWSREEYWGVAQLINLHGPKAHWEAERDGLHRLAGRIGDYERALEILAGRGSVKTVEAA